MNVTAPLTLESHGMTSDGRHNPALASSPSLARFRASEPPQRVQRACDGQYAAERVRSRTRSLEHRAPVRNASAPLQCAFRSLQRSRSRPALVDDAEPEVAVEVQQPPKLYKIVTDRAIPKENLVNICFPECGRKITASREIDTPSLWIPPQTCNPIRFSWQRGRSAR